MRRRAATIIKSSDPMAETDPFRELVKDFKPLEGDQVGKTPRQNSNQSVILPLLLVLINPIVKKKDHKVIALMTVSQFLSQKDVD